MELVCALWFWVTIGSTYLCVLKLFLLGFVKFWISENQISPSTLYGAAVSVALYAGVSLVFILKAGD